MRIRTAATASLAFLMAGCAMSAKTPTPAGRRAATPAAEGALPTHGLAIGDVTAESAVVWSRTDRPATLHAVLTSAAGGQSRRASVDVRAEDDFAGQLDFRGLRPGTEYSVWGWFSGPGSASAPASDTSLQATFRTAPGRAEPAPVSFAFGGDLGGQNVCRDSREGYPIFWQIDAAEPDFFLGLGDMIYADDACEGRGRYGNDQIPGDFPPASDLSEFWAHWRYNRADPGFQTLLVRAPYYAVWDDHEVANDFGPGGPLPPLGLAAFLDWNPVREDPRDPTRLHRRFRWGRHLELFLLDTRQHRDANRAADEAGSPKSVLGADQRSWLLAGLTDSDATWKVIVTSVPLSIPTGSDAETRGRDGWADGDLESGFESELLGILTALRDRGIANTLWLTTDVHFATGFRYAPFRDDPDFETFELVTGPLQAGLFPKKDLDDSLRPERLFFYGASSPDAVTSWAAARRWFNFGIVAIDETGALTLGVRDVDGKRVFERRLEPR